MILDLHSLLAILVTATGCLLATCDWLNTQSRNRIDNYTFFEIPIPGYIAQCNYTKLLYCHHHLHYYYYYHYYYYCYYYYYYF